MKHNKDTSNKWMEQIHVIIRFNTQHTMIFPQPAMSTMVQHQSLPWQPTIHNIRHTISTIRTNTTPRLSLSSSPLPDSVDCRVAILPAPSSEVGC